jgi:hypothetical protein
MRRSFWVQLGLAVILVGSLHADEASSKADFQLGQKYQAAKQWGPAVQAYRQALKDDPKAIWAYKALGTTYYLAGDRRGAVAYYNYYLRLNPQDTATHDFNERLKASLGAASSPAKAGTVAAATQHHGGWSLRLDGGLVLNNGADVAALYTSPYESASAPGGMAASFGLGVDYGFAGGFIGGLDLIDGPSRGYNVTFNGTSAGTWAITNVGVILTPGWSFKVGPAWSLEPRLGLGYLSSSVKFSSSSGGNADSASAAGVAIWPQFRVERLFGAWGLGINLGYLVATFSPVKLSDGTVIQQTSASGSASNWALSNGGLSSSLFVTYHFGMP